MLGLRMPELLLILAVLLLLFGASRLPQLGRSLGGAIRGFQKAVSREGEEPAGGSQAALTEGSPGALGGTHEHREPAVAAPRPAPAPRGA
ncbi:MAG TPA: twin-arginine translocase TatA/TatE family subunit [Anaeromyxobacteraceae bacterium]|nr:twin-arginine translocase TatA/TatE family subunit [Anaeromyxobacteraceae bacterium]